MKADDFGRRLPHRRKLKEGEQGLRQLVLLDTLDAFEARHEHFRQMATENMRRWLAAVALHGSSNTQGQCHVEAVAGDWGDVTLSLTKRYGVAFAVLNMANAFVPGGGYVDGMAAQEENMFRRSDCHFSLTKECMRSNGAYQTEVSSLLNAENGRVYCDKDHPRICVRGPEDPNDARLGYAWLPDNQIFHFFELRAAAPDLRDKRITFDQAEILRRVEAQLNTLQDAGIRHVVLSAFGCGAFLNPADRVAQAYSEALKSRRDAFDVICFAVFHAGYGPDNFPAFEHVFPAASSSSPASLATPVRSKASPAKAASFEMVVPHVEITRKVVFDVPGKAPPSIIDDFMRKYMDQGNVVSRTRHSLLEKRSNAQIEYEQESSTRFSSPTQNTIEDRMADVIERFEAQSKRKLTIDYWSAVGSQTLLDLAVAALLTPACHNMESGRSTLNLFARVRSHAIQDPPVKPDWERIHTAARRSQLASQKKSLARKVSRAQSQGGLQVAQELEATLQQVNDKLSKACELDGAVANELELAIHGCSCEGVKAVNICTLLDAVLLDDRTGKGYSLQEMHTWETLSVREWFTSLDGFGIKLAMCVITYGMVARPAQPIDTRALTVQTRLGWLKPIGLFPVHALSHSQFDFQRAVSLGLLSQELEFSGRAKSNKRFFTKRKPTSSSRLYCIWNLYNASIYNRRWC